MKYITIKFFILLSFLFILGACSKDDSQISLSKVSIQNNKIILTGNNLNQARSASIKKGNEKIVVGFKVLSDNKIEIETRLLSNFKTEKILEFFISSGHASASFSLNVTTCTANLNGAGFDCTLNLVDGDVFSFDGVASKWITRGKGSQPINANMTTDYIITSTDSIITVNAATNDITLTLPTAVGISGRQYTIKKIDTSIHKVNIATANSELIDGKASYFIRLPYEYITMISNGVGWVITNTMGELRSCPDGMVLLGNGRSTFCVEKTPRVAATYPDASQICWNAGYNLCNFNQFGLACRAGAPFVYNSSNLEWGVEARGGINTNAVTLGAGDCFNGHDTVGYILTPTIYRCCLE